MIPSSSTHRRRECGSVYAARPGPPLEHCVSERSTRTGCFRLWIAGAGEQETLASEDGPTVRCWLMGGTM